jgi:hypothetical protein
MPATLWRTLHSFWPLVHPCPPSFTRSTIHSFVRGGSSFSFSFFFSHTHTLSFLTPLSPRLSPRQPSHPHCSMISLPLLSPSLAHSRWPILAGRSSLADPRWPILAGSPSLPHPRCPVLAPLSSLHLHLRTPHILGLCSPSVCPSSYLFPHPRFLVLVL